MNVGFDDTQPALLEWFAHVRGAFDSGFVAHKSPAAEVCGAANTQLVIYISSRCSRAQRIDRCMHPEHNGFQHIHTRHHRHTVPTSKHKQRQPTRQLFIAAQLTPCFATQMALQ
eukprot:COSAG04_NODE_2250_length_4446_cov_52.316310_1_plen_113_part_10